MTMFGTLVQRLTSPVSSPNSPRRRYYEVQSEPEDEPLPTTRKSRGPAGHLLEKRKTGGKSWQDLAFPSVRGTKSLSRLDGFKQVQRLAEYEKYFEKNVQNLSLNGNGVNSGTVFYKEQLKGDLHRIQDLFPNDNLRLHEQHVVTSQAKNFIRKRNGTISGKIPRALSQKSLNIINSSSLLVKSPPRIFYLEGPVQLTRGMQSQERHLFLFSDLLLIAKGRNGTFRLKQSVKMSEVWLSADHIDEVSETKKSQETSFVMGWPTTNVVVSFMTAAARDLWWTRLNELIREENLKEPSDTSIQVIYHDSNTEYRKSIMVSSDMTAAACAKLAARLLKLQGSYQLWARTNSEEAPYPLIGHEKPFAIKLSNLRHKLSLEEGFDLEHCSKSGHDTCHFILKAILCNPSTGVVPTNYCNNINVSVNNNNSNSSNSNRSGGKKSKSKITGLLRRSLSLSPSIFGVSLSRLDENGLPKPVLVMLQQLFAKGPYTQGIFRKSANVRIVRELRDHIETTGDSSSLEDAPIVAVAALLKDFLRSLPDPLLTSHLYPLWMAALSSNEPIRAINSVLERLPKPNYTLLSHLICVLHHIARRSKHNLMCASNLGVCCGPSLLWSLNPSVNQSRAIPQLTELLIRHCEILFGESVTQLFGEERSDSGAEESTDSLHCESLDSIPQQQHQQHLHHHHQHHLHLQHQQLHHQYQHMRHQRSSPPRKDHISLSRDSGLTLSDCQLFAPESPPPAPPPPPPLPPPSPPVMSNPNFQRQDWVRHQLKRVPRVCLGELHRFRQAEAVDEGEDDEVSDDKTVPPPPLPPRLRHLPPVHMSLEDRHKLAGRSRSLPPPPPYRPPPQPEHHRRSRPGRLGLSHSLLDDESYV